MAQANHQLAGMVRSGDHAITQHGAAAAPWLKPLPAPQDKTPQALAKRKLRDEVW